jgi:hypothetical protein
MPNFGEKKTFVEKVWGWLKGEKMHFGPGLPDGLFSTQKSQFG